jgi:hypothetical protein
MTIDPRLREAIIDAARGEDSPWPVDKHYPGKGTPEQRFRGGDDQAVLWAIALAEECEQQIPKWAAAALMEKLLEISVAAKDWDGVFGPPRAKRGGDAPGANEGKIQHRAKYMFKCFDAVQARSANGERIDPALFESVGKELDVGGARSGAIVSRYYYAVKNWRAKE